MTPKLTEHPASIEHEIEDASILAAAAEPHRARLLRTARELTCGDRNASYGDPVANHEHIAEIFNAITGRDLTARECALLHVATKLARQRTSPRREDSYVDLMAYAGIAFECALADDGGSQ